MLVWLTYSNEFSSKHTSVKLKNNPIDPLTLNAESIKSFSFGKHGEHVQSSTDLDWQQILLIASHDGWSLITLELKPQHVNVVWTSSFKLSGILFQPSSANEICFLWSTAKHEHAIANWTIKRQNKIIM